VARETAAKSPGRKPRKPAAKRPALVKQKHGGALLTGGIPGNKGGPGRPPNELRQGIRELGWLALEETRRRVEAARRTVPPREQLERMKKAELIDLLLQIGEWLEITPGALRQILDTAYKYGVGTKHVMATEDESPLEILIRRERP